MLRHAAPLQPTLPANQGGIAIITVLLVIALATITISSMVGRQQLDLRRERNEAFIQQARSFAISGEKFAAAVLFRDVEQGDRENSDSLDDDWAQTLPPVPIDNATIEGCVVDMQGKFNLNNLIDPEGNAVQPYVEQLGRLLQELNIDAAKLQAVVDWLDEDVNALTPDGAEDDYYSGLDPSYRTANSSFVSVSELQLVKGFSSQVAEEQADFEKLLPHIAALPIAQGATPVNVNTATPQVLSSLSEFLQPLGADLSRWDTEVYADYPECENIFDLSAEETANTLEEDRDTTPYESTLIFEDSAAPESGESIGEPGSYNVRSNYFQVRIDVTTEGVKLTQYTLLERDTEGKTRIIRRSRDTL